MMVLYFSGTGNSRYIAAQIAQALCVPTLDLNVRIQAADTSPVQTGPDIVLVTPTYAWRIPRIVEQWLEATPLPQAQRIWFVMDCGSEIGSADHYNRRLAQRKQLRPMGTAPIQMPENYIAMFSAPDPAQAGASWTAPPLLSSRPLTASRPDSLLPPPAKICTTVL